ncbi:MAG: ACT domain-containing protein [archaeon GB-1867-005]|nr:ACT domain-containing protein [Candidatus Culexmicrobium cathedralense]
MSNSGSDISVAEAVRRIILQHPSITDCIKMGVINYSALAARIKPEVEKTTGRRNVRIEAIKMALIRFSDELIKDNKILENKIREVIANTVLELKSDIVVLTVRQEALTDKLDSLMKRVVASRFFQLTQGLQTFTLIFDGRELKKVVEIIGEDDIEVFIDNQSAIILLSPRSVIEVPGVISYITALLARKGINITQIISCHEDTILIVDRKDASKAFATLEKAILDLRSENCSK